MREIDPSPFAGFMAPPKSKSLGIKPNLSWLAVGDLRIDPAYQREVLRNGARNIAKIAEKFDWSLFGVVVVASLGEGLYAIVDGQHRTIAASLRGIAEVPCIIIHADPEKQAEAFAAINGAVTAIHPLAIFAAEVAAKNPVAVDIMSACDEAGITVLRYPVPSNAMKAGQTIAIGTIRKCYNTYGRKTLVLAMKALHKASQGEKGMISAPSIKAMCHILEAEKSFGKPEYRLIALMENYSLPKALKEIDEDPVLRKRAKHLALTEKIFEYIEDEIGD